VIRPRLRQHVPPDQTPITAAVPTGQPAVPVEPTGGDPFPEPGDDWAPAPSARAVTLSVATITTSLLVAVAAVLPVPYAISSPGPTRDTLGEFAGTSLITVEGEETYESSGQLLLTTVSVSGGPGYPVGLPTLVRGWFDPSRAVRPVEEVFAPTETQEEIDARNQAAMISSQENATVAALEELGYEVPAVLRVADPVAGTGAEGVVRQDDVIVALEGEELTGFSHLVRLLQDVEPGDTVTLGVLREDERHDLELVTTDSGDGRALLGVYVDPEFDMPVDVSIAIENIGGPSAGMMFALGIIDTLTPEDETGGEVVAGSGTVDVAGAVGPIGGIRQKLAGASRDGASWFLAAQANCDDVSGFAPDGLRVVAVSTLGEARAALQAIGEGRTDDLPSCS
jgi:Lon-like protease